MITQSFPDPLTALQLQVARRADELAAAGQRRSLLNLSCWLQAEEEILSWLRGPASDPVAEHFQPGPSLFAGRGEQALSA
jgi:hypothetical protein